jgi:hypothetical protein
MKVKKSVSFEVLAMSAALCIGSAAQRPATAPSAFPSSPIFEWLSGFHRLEVSCGFSAELFNNQQQAETYFAERFTACS